MAKASTNLLIQQINTIVELFPTASTNMLSIYSGAMPSTTVGFSPSLYTGNLLVTLTNFLLTNYNMSVRYHPSSPPPLTTGISTGTASWFALYQSTNYNKVIIGQCSIYGGTGSLYLTDLNIVTGNILGTTELGIGGVLL